MKYKNIPKEDSWWEKLQSEICELSTETNEVIKNGSGLQTDSSSSLHHLPD